MRLPLLFAFLVAGALPLTGADPHLRFARVRLAEDGAEIEDASGRRSPARPNAAAGQGFWMETRAGRAEVELDEGSVARLGPASLLELSDLARLSNGYRVTRFSLERGVLYVTAQPGGGDTFTVALPGIEVTMLAGSRLRADVDEKTSAVTVLEGRVRFSSRPGEMELTPGRTARVDPANLERFELLRQPQAGPLDSWNAGRDQEAAQRGRGTRLAAFPFGLGELDEHGSWIDAPGLGRVWQPRVRADWAPYRLGHWQWEDPLGCAWISSESWGWLPYHYGRWTRLPQQGWVWAADPAFHAGEVYWLRSGSRIGWGPLAPGEIWRADAAPSLYTPAATTYAVLRAESRVIEPGPAPSRPGAAMATVRWMASLPAPPAGPAATARTVASRVRSTPTTPPVTARASEGPRSASGIRIVGAEPPLPPPPPATPPGLGYSYYPYVTGPPPEGEAPGAVPMLEPPPAYYPYPEAGGYYPGVIYVPRGPYRPGPGYRRLPPGVVMRPGRPVPEGSRPPGPAQLGPPAVQPVPPAVQPMPPANRPGPPALPPTGGERGGRPGFERGR